MPKKIDHELRKENILKTALSVFADVGYRESAVLRMFSFLSS